MQKIAKFEKVSFENFLEAYLKFKGETNIEIIKKIYQDILLPRRATIGSAGYDFFMIDAVCIRQGETLLVPTGIRVSIVNGWVLKLYPRSGLGFKYRLQLDNTVGIIDSDYYYSDNEGHIFCKITCDAKEEKELLIKKGMAFMQGVFVEYGITYDDDATEIRNGGFGSTSKQENVWKLNIMKYLN